MTKHSYLCTSRGRLLTDGLSFEEEGHRYLYRGHDLSGVTGKISKKLKKNFDTSFVDEGRNQGNHVHDAIERYLTEGKSSSVHPAVTFATGKLSEFQEQGMVLYSEVLVSDFKAFASAVDILAVLPDGKVILFDTKAGVFNREYVSWQLGVYKQFIEDTTDFVVSRCYCLSTRDCFFIRLSRNVGKI
jgi:hypothetical protein